MKSSLRFVLAAAVLLFATSLVMAAPVNPFPQPKPHASFASPITPAPSPIPHVAMSSPITPAPSPIPHAVLA